MEKNWKQLIENAREMCAVSRKAKTKNPDDKEWVKIHARNLAHLKSVKASAAKFMK